MKILVYTVACDPVRTLPITPILRPVPYLSPDTLYPDIFGGGGLKGGEKRSRVIMSDRISQNGGRGEIGECEHHSPCLLLRVHVSTDFQKNACKSLISTVASKLARTSLVSEISRGVTAFEQ